MAVIPSLKTSTHIAELSRVCFSNRDSGANHIANVSHEATTIYIRSVDLHMRGKGGKFVKAIRIHSIRFMKHVEYPIRFDQFDAFVQC